MPSPSQAGIRLFLSLLGFAGGLASAIVIHQLFTGISLIETVLVCVPAIYLTSTWFSRSTIGKYRDSGYSPGRRKRAWDDFWVNVAVFVVEPICMSFIYAGLVLLICKWIAPDQLKRIANGVYELYVFSKTYIKKPLAILIAVLSVAVLLKVISHTLLKRAKTLTKWIGFPLQITATLLFFIQADHGLANKYVSWKINEEMFQAKPGQTESFDASAENAAEVKQIIADYVETMIDQLDQDWHSVDTSNATSTALPFRESLMQLEQSWEKDVTIREDLYAGLGGVNPSVTYAAEDQHNVDEILNNYAEVKAHTDFFVTSPLYNDAYQATPGSRKSIIDILTDERTSIRERVTTPNQEILESLLGDAIGHTWFFKTLPDDISFYAFAKDKSFDLLKDKLTEGLSFIFGKAKDGVLKKVDVEIIKEYVSSQCGKAYVAANQFIRTSRGLVTGLSLQYAEALTVKSKAVGNLRTFTAGGCRSFITQFPHDPQAEFFQKYLPFLEYTEGDENALEQFDIDYMRQYFEKHLPEAESQKIKPGLDALQERKDFVFAKDKNTSEGWNDFLAKYPNSPYATVIQQHVERLKENEDLRAAISVNSRSGWQDFLEKHPNHPDHETIAGWIERNDFSAMHTEPPHFAPVHEFHLPPVAEEEGLMSILEHIRF